MKIVGQISAVILTSLLVLSGCSSRLSESEASKQIKNAWDAKWGFKDSTVEIIGISMEGKTAIVKAGVTGGGSLRNALGTKVHNFHFRKYDTGWAVESFQ